MTRDELIAKCNFHLGAADGAQQLNHHEHYAKHMSALLDLLIEELVDCNPGTAESPPPKRSKP